jgi:hypothetical protein
MYCTANVNYIILKIWEGKKTMSKRGENEKEKKETRK